MRARGGVPLLIPLKKKKKRETDRETGRKGLAGSSPQSQPERGREREVFATAKRLDPEAPDLRVGWCVVFFPPAEEEGDEMLEGART